MLMTGTHAPTAMPSTHNQANGDDKHDLLGDPHHALRVNNGSRAASAASGDMPEALSPCGTSPVRSVRPTCWPCGRPSCTRAPTHRRTERVDRGATRTWSLRFPKLLVRLQRGFQADIHLHPLLHALKPLSPQKTCHPNPKLPGWMAGRLTVRATLPCRCPLPDRPTHGVPRFCSGLSPSALRTTAVPARQRSSA